MAAAAATVDVEKALRERFVAKQREVASSEREGTRFSIKKAEHYLNLTMNHVFMWTSSDAVRELVTNCLDGCVEATAEAQCDGGVEWEVCDSGASLLMAREVGLEPEEMVTEWRAVATLSRVELGEIHFARAAKDDKLCAFITNHFTCLHLLKIFGFGFSTKADDPTQSGKFGDGLKSATVTLARSQSQRVHSDRFARCAMSLMTNGRVWTFDFDTSEEPAWLRARKTSKNAAGTNFKATEKRDTVIVLQWEDARVGMRDVFDPAQYLAFDKNVSKLDLGGGAALINGEAYIDTVYVAGVRVCRSKSFVTGAGYMDDEMLKGRMTRDRSVIATDHICKSFAKRAGAYLEAGGEVDRIYELTAALNDDRWNSAFYYLSQRAKGSTWAGPFADYFRQKEGEDAFPYAEAGHRFVIEHDLGRKPVRVNNCLYKILRNSPHFSSVEAAVVREFEIVGKKVPWPQDSKVFRCVNVVTDELCRRAWNPDGDVAKRVHLCDVRCERPVVAKSRGYDTEMEVFLNAANVKRVETKSPTSMLKLLHDVMHAIQDALDTSLDRKHLAHMYTLIGDIARGRFDECYATDTEEEEEETATDDDDDDDDDELVGCGVDSDSEPPSRKRKDRESDSEAPEPSPAVSPPPLKRGRLDLPTPANVPDEPVGKYRSEAPLLPPNPQDGGGGGGSTHEHTADLYAMCSIRQHNATVFGEAGELAMVDQKLIEVASVVRDMLRHCFDWDDSTIFGVFDDRGSGTMAFTRGGKELFINAAHHPVEETDTSKVAAFYFTTLCHETAHMLGYSGHGEAFASAMGRVVEDRQPQFLSFLMKKHVTDECDSECVLGHQLTCSLHV